MPATYHQQSMCSYVEKHTRALMCSRHVAHVASSRRQSSRSQWVSLALFLDGMMRRRGTTRSVLEHLSVNSCDAIVMVPNCRPTPLLKKNYTPVAISKFMSPAPYATMKKHGTNIYAFTNRASVQHDHPSLYILDRLSCINGSLIRLQCWRREVHRMSSIHASISFFVWCVRAGVRRARLCAFTCQH